MKLRRAEPKPKGSVEWRHLVGGDLFTDGAGLFVRTHVSRIDVLAVHLGDGHVRVIPMDDMPLWRVRLVCVDPDGPLVWAPRT